MIVYPIILGSLSAGVNSASLGQIVFSNSNGMAFGLNGQTMTASYTVPGATVFSNSNNVSFGLNGSTITASASFNQSVQPAIQSIQVSNTTYTIGNVIFSNANGASFGSSAGGAITISYTVPGATVFSNSNNVSFGLNGSTVTATATFNQTAQPGIQSIQVSNTTYTTGNVIFSNANGASFGSSAGGAVTISYTVPVVTNSSWTVSDANTSGTVGRLAFTNLNGVTLSLSSGAGGSHTIVGSHNGITSQSNQNVSLFALGNTTQNSSTVLNASNLSYNGLGMISMGFSNGSIQISATQSNQNISLFALGNTTQNSSTVLNASNLSFNAIGPITMGFSNGSIQVSGATVAASPVNFSAAGSSNNLGSVVFSNLNNVTFGLTGSTITASVASQTNQTIGFYATGNTTQNSSTTLDARSITFNATGNITMGFSNGSIQVSEGYTLSTFAPFQIEGASTIGVPVIQGTSAIVSIYPFVVPVNVSAGIMNMMFSMGFQTVGTSSGRQTAGFMMGIYTRNTNSNSSRIESIVSQSFSWQVTGNNSSYTVNQVTQTAYSGYGATGATNSAGVNLSNAYVGAKLVEFPVNTLLTPGQYWLAIIGTNSTSSINVGITMSFFGAAAGTWMTQLGPIGSFSSAYSLGADPFGGRWNVGNGSWSSAGSVTGLPASMAFTSISAGDVRITPFIKFWST